MAAQFLKSLVLRLVPDAPLQLLKKRHYLRSLRNSTFADEPELVILEGLVATGDVVVDAGANVGLYTRFFSEWVGASGRVHSIEPVPSTFDILAWCVERQGLANVQLHPVAASDTSGEAVIEIPHYESGGENAYMASIVEGTAQATPGHRRVRIDTRPIDALLGSDAGPIGVVKCDVEGHELEAVRGASELIRRDHPAWMVEVSGDPDEDADARTLFAHFREAGYAAWWFDAGRLRARATGDASTNYFFLMPGHVERLRHADLLHDGSASPPATGGA